MSAADSDSKKLCPACGAREGVEVVYVHPVEERVQETDRRQQHLTHTIPESGDRRKNPDRRLRNEWHQLPGGPANPLLGCLACLHEWRCVASHAEFPDTSRNRLFAGPLSA